MQWARRNRNAFYGQMLPKAVAADEKRVQEEEVLVKSEPKTVQERLAMHSDFMERAEAERRRRGTRLLNAGDGPRWPG